MKKTRFYLLVALVVVIELIVLRQQSQARARLHTENQRLELQASQMTSLVSENRQLTHDVSPASSVASQLDELNHLRSNVADQQRQMQDLQTELAAQPTLPSFQSLAGSNRFVNLPKESWVASGYSTPEAALETMLWATAHGDINTLRASLTPDELERRNNGTWKGKTDSEIADAGVQGLSQVSGLQILNIQNENHFTLYVSGLKQPDQPLWMDMKLIDGEWKVDRLVGE